MADIIASHDLQDQRDFNDDANAILDAELHEQGVAERAKTIAARRQHIRDTARCRDCGTDQATCRNLAPDADGRAALCCWNGRGHSHDEDHRALDALLDEIERGGRIRTVAEVNPPPVLGPRRVSDRWLLGQDVWWYPNRRPAVRIVEMDKPWRFNTARFIERRADALAYEEHSHMAWIAAGPLGPSGDMAQDGFRREMNSVIEEPLQWLRSTPLLQRLRDGLPHPDSRKGKALAERARHWNTCPRRKAHPARQRCTCITADGRTVGATNDPVSRMAWERNALMTPEWTT